MKIFNIKDICKKLYICSGLFWVNQKIESFLAWRINFLLLNHWKIYWWPIQYSLFWIKNNVKLWKGVKLGNALLNVNSWKIVVWDYTFCWHNVSIITWTHNYNKFWKDRQFYPNKWNDIIIWKWVRICSNAIILWPCKIWDNSVIAAWAIVTDDVPEWTIVWWVPAKIIKKIY